MSAPLPVLPLDKPTYERALSCVHCGLCLAACPTYLQTAHEADSPRGRIQLIRGLADGTVQATDSVRRHLDLCLDCRACETACPSNVIYHELIEAARIGLNQNYPPPLKQRLFRWLCFHVAVHPMRLKLALLPLRLLGIKRLPPGALWPRRPTSKPGRGKAKVALFTGCVTDVLFNSVNQQAAELLAAAGADVLVPRSQTCCGAIHYHNGSVAPAQAMARRNIDALRQADFIASTAAGCGAMLMEYDHLLRDDPRYAEVAKELSAKVRDVTEVLLELGMPEMGALPLTVTIHDACHLAHAQRAAAAPRKLLARIPELNLIPLPESDHCCGAAGTYFFTQPTMARALAERKLKNIQSTGVAVCVTSNAGCALHLRARAAAGGQELKIVHPVELLHAAAGLGRETRTKD
jgi:glycolate oxidase iron-sulfur subunit